MGCSDGMGVGDNDGVYVGLLVGCELGAPVGGKEGTLLGWLVGVSVGEELGLFVGAALGPHWDIRPARQSSAVDLKISAWESTDRGLYPFIVRARDMLNLEDTNELVPTSSRVLYIIWDESAPKNGIRGEPSPRSRRIDTPKSEAPSLHPLNAESSMTISNV